MRTLSTLLFLFAFAQTGAAEPLTYELQLVYVFDSTPTEFVFVIGNSGFKSIESLERFIATMPEGTTIRWAPGCLRIGGEPLLSSEDDMTAFQEFCREHHVKLVIVPSG